MPREEKVRKGLEKRLPPGAGEPPGGGENWGKEGFGKEGYFMGNTWRRTSARLVVPSLAFSRPSRARGIMPSCTALALTSLAEARRKRSSRIPPVMGRSSKTPVLPRKPEPEQTSHPRLA